MRLFKVCLIFSAALILGACGGDQTEPPSGRVARFDTTADGKTIHVYSDSLVIDLVGVNSVTVLDLLQQSHQVEYRSTMNGAFVTEIDAHKSNDSYFWVYTVNDTTAALACDKYLTSDGDRVKWHYRKFSR